MSILRKKPNILNRNRSKVEEVEEAESVQDNDSPIQLGRKLNFKCHLCDQSFRTRREIKPHISRFHDPKSILFQKPKSILVQNINGSVIMSSSSSLEPMNFKTDIMESISGTILAPVNIEKSVNKTDFLNQIR